MEDKLFMIGLGGSIQGANMEVHDIQLVKSHSKEEAFDISRDRWYGDSLHVDSYIEIEYIDGYRINFNKPVSKRLYMIVYGGYKSFVIDEQHEYYFVVADSIEEAKEIGKKNKAKFKMDHVDNVVDVFKNVGMEFGFNEGNYTFDNNLLTHTYIKLK